jgi:hypothetical protein
VLGIHVAPDGKIIINGDFDNYYGANYISGNKNITRLLADGSPDPYWNPAKAGGAPYTRLPLTMQGMYLVGQTTLGTTVQT